VAGQSHREDRAELAEVQSQLRELQQMIEAIRSGSVDSLIIGPPGQEQVHYTADRSYRLIVEAMNEGAATVSSGGVILGANPRRAGPGQPVLRCSRSTAGFSAKPAAATPTASRRRARGRAPSSMTCCACRR
jgi:hypothetical protein